MEVELDPSKLQNILEGIKKTISEEVKNHKPSSEERPADVHTTFLIDKTMEIKKLKSDVQSFENPGKHFTKQYRIMEGYCGKLQTDLDEIDGTGRENLRVLRKKALKDISEILDTLTKKAHEDGIPCSNCEAKELV